MSRIGNAPIEIPENTTVELKNSVVHVKGPKGELEQAISDHVTVNIDGNIVAVSRKDDSKESKSHHGLTRSLINNMIEGVSKGFQKKLELNGVGFRATSNGQQLELVIGFSHNVLFELPNEVKVTTESERGKAPLITLDSFDKQLLGSVAAKIRSLRKPEPYKGKGIKFTDEIIRRKAGKTAAKK